MPSSWSWRKQVSDTSLKLIFMLSDEKVCNRLPSNVFKISNRLSWKIPGDVILTKYMERSNESCSTDISPHGLQAGFRCSCSPNTFWLLKATLEWQFIHAGCFTWTSKSQQLSSLLFALWGPTRFAQATEWNLWAQFCYRCTAEIGLKPMDLPQIYRHKQNEFLTL